MNPFFQVLLNNSPVLLALFYLFYLIKKHGFKLEQHGLKMEQGFKNVDNEFKLFRAEMKRAFREIKGTKKRLRRLERSGHSN